LKKSLGQESDIWYFSLLYFM